MQALFQQDHVCVTCLEIAYFIGYFSLLKYNVSLVILPLFPIGICPMIGCLNICPNGYIKDENGCDTCKCQ